MHFSMGKSLQGEVVLRRSRKVSLGDFPIWPTFHVMEQENALARNSQKYLSGVL